MARQLRPVHVQPYSFYKGLSSHGYQPSFGIYDLTRRGLDLGNLFRCARPICPRGRNMVYYSEHCGSAVPGGLQYCILMKSVCLVHLK
jgi:hypothetical protein